MELIQYPDEIKVITDFFDSDECESIIKRSEEMGFEEAPINTLGGAELFKEARNNNRVMFDDYDLAEELFQKIRTYLPQEFIDCSLYNLNERFRIYRYER